MLDSFAILSYLQHERGAETVRDLFLQAKNENQFLLISAVNWAEVRCQVKRKIPDATWHEICNRLLVLPIHIAPVDKTLAELAGEIKMSQKMSLADCFVVALAKQKSAAIYTGDPDFRKVESEIKVAWL